MRKLLQRYQEGKVIEKWLLNAFVIFTLGFLIDYSILHSYEYLDKSFTKITADASKHLLVWITGADVGAYVESIGIQICTKGDHCVYVGDACNGRNLYLIYIGLLISIPYGNWKNKVLFSIVGSLLIFTANITRIILLVLFIDISVDIFSLLHHYVFQILLYLLMFGLWNVFFNRYKTVSHETE